MTRRLEAGPLLVTLGALLLLVSLFLNWFTGEIRAWEAFEAWDLVLFLLALGAIAAGLGLTRDAVEVGGEDQTHTDTGADGGEAVAEVGDVPSHCVSFRGRRVRPGVGLFWWSCGGAYGPRPVVSGAR